MSSISNDTHASRHHRNEVAENHRDPHWLGLDLSCQNNVSLNCWMRQEALSTICTSGSGTPPGMDEES